MEVVAKAPPNLPKGEEHMGKQFLLYRIKALDNKKSHLGDLGGLKIIQNDNSIYKQTTH